MATEAQKAAMRRYYHKTKDTKRSYMLRFDKNADADVIAVMDAAPSKTDYIRKIIRSRNGELK